MSQARQLLLRRHKVVEILDENQLDALLVCNLCNIRYLCGFTGSDGFLIMTRDHTIFMSDSRYTLQAQEQVRADHIAEYKLKAEALIDTLRDLGVRRIGFEAGLAFGWVQELQSKGERFWVWSHLGAELTRLRLHKDETEVDLIQQAAALHGKVFPEVQPLIRSGVPESEIALQLEFALKKAGAEEKSFDFIVASGPRGALPHGVATQRRLRQDELVTIDFGCCLNGYHSDETVTLAVGEVPSSLRQVYDTVLEAHDLALAAVRPGVPLVELDRIARDLITRAGYGDYFGHGLGHGVGLEVHEVPNLSPRSSHCAEAGMVFTIEPGVYIPGVGGVRIEDMVLVTDNGARVLTQLSKRYQNTLRH